MTKSDFDRYFSDFISVLEKSHFSKKEFLFHSRPYVNGFYHILKKIETLPPTDHGSPLSSRILDLGVGTGLSSYLLARMKYLVSAIDIYDPGEDIQNAFKEKSQVSQSYLWKNLEQGMGNLSFRFFNGLHIPYENNAFDFVFAHAVIEHIPQSRLLEILKEIFRVLRVGGYFVIARTPNTYALTEFLSKTHDTRFTKTQLLKLLKGHRTVYYQKTDFFPEMMPGILQVFLNYFSPVLHFMDQMISRTPLSILSHHHFLIVQKES